MDRDEILERSRKENRDRDFVEEEATNKAHSIALSVGMIVCGLISVLSGIFQENGVNFSVWIVMWSIWSAVFLVKYHRLRKRHELLFGLFYAVLALFFFVLYLRRELGVF